MQLTAYNPQKGRLETLEVECTQENTTWFRMSRNANAIAMITDYKGGLLIRKDNYEYPMWIYDVSRSDIGYSRKKAQELVRDYV
jgi:hypothetical protein